MKTTFVLFLAFLALYLLTMGGHLYSPDEEMMPVCEGHHQGLRDTSKIAIHKDPAKWREKYGRDKDWLEYANELIAEYNN